MPAVEVATDGSVELAHMLLYRLDRLPGLFPHVLHPAGFGPGEGEWSLFPPVREPAILSEQLSPGQLQAHLCGLDKLPPVGDTIPLAGGRLHRCRCPNPLHGAHHALL